MYRSADDNDHHCYGDCYAFYENDDNDDKRNDEEGSSVEV